MSIKHTVPCIVLFVASANAQLEKPIDSLIPRESSAAYLNTHSRHSSAVDAKGVRHQASDYAGTAPWINDRVKFVAPEYPYSERLHRHEGQGIVQLTLDLKTGLVTTSTVIKSTGFSTLDNCAVSAFQRWTWKPGKWKEIDLPVTFRLGNIHAPLPAGAVRLQRP
jgi:TonB family protein